MSIGSVEPLLAAPHPIARAVVLLLLILIIGGALLGAGRWSGGVRRRTRRRVRRRMRRRWF